MIKVYSKLRNKESFKFDVIFEWDEKVNDPQLRCDLMNIAPSGQFTYISETSFSCVGDSSKKALAELQRKVEDVYSKYEKGD